MLSFINIKVYLSCLIENKNDQISIIKRGSGDYFNTHQCILLAELMEKLLGFCPLYAMEIIK